MLDTAMSCVVAAPRCLMRSAIVESQKGIDGIDGEIDAFWNATAIISFCNKV